MVARIRVSPKDCMGIVDIMKGMGMNPYEHSFSGCVALSMSALIAVARKGGIIPKEEDGFQYLNVMESFLDQPSTRAKRERTNQLYERAQQGLDNPAPPMPDLVIARPYGEQKIAMEQRYKVMLGMVQGGTATDAQLVEFLEMQKLLF